MCRRCTGSQAYPRAAPERSGAGRLLLCRCAARYDTRLFRNERYRTRIILCVVLSLPPRACAADGQDLATRYSVSVCVHRSGFFVWSSGGGAALCPSAVNRRVSESVPPASMCARLPTPPPGVSFSHAPSVLPVPRARTSRRGRDLGSGCTFDFVTFSLRDVTLE